MGALRRVRSPIWIGAERRTPGRGQDAVGEEPGQRFDDQVLADEDVGRVPVVPGLMAVPGSADAAAVVGVVLAHQAAHPPPAQVADDVGPQDVGAGGGSGTATTSVDDLGEA